MIKYVKKLVSYPKEVWDDVENYVWDKYRIGTPQNEYRFYKLIHSKAFNYRKFVTNISKNHAMVLFVLVCKKLGIGFIKTDSTIEMVIVKDSAIEAIEYYVDNTERLKLEPSQLETEQVAVTQ